MKYAIVARADPQTPQQVIDAALVSAMRALPPISHSPLPLTLFFVELITHRRLVRLAADLGVPCDVALTSALEKYLKSA